jgi:hypothetical protein
MHLHTLRFSDRKIHEEEMEAVHTLTTIVIFVIFSDLCLLHNALQRRGEVS